VSAPLDADVVVVGAGIIGLAVARRLVQVRPGARVVVLDKEDHVAAHQSGHNSGVIHAGVYYKPGSRKAELCRAGRTELLALCRDRGIPFDVCGKVVVATDADELPALAALEERSHANGLTIERLDATGLRAVEPHVRGVAALHVRETAIVDFPAVCAELAAELRAGGVELHLDSPVVSLVEHADGVEVATGSAPAGPASGSGGRASRSWRAGAVVNAAGLQSDRIARLVRGPHGDPLLDARSLPRIMPFRGEYHELVPEACHLVRNLVYPVPDPQFPFLGVHLTRGVHGGVHAGPNAVPALAREGYRAADIDRHEVAELVRSRATWHLARRHWRAEADELLRSVSPARFTASVQRLVPDVRAGDLVRSGSGVRAQAVSASGELLDDFAFAGTARTLHVLNAPSPAATASLAIAAHIVRELPAAGA
jgi:L-2-hydroxyglutarate oxidase